MASEQPCYTLINPVAEFELPSEQDLRKTLESGNLAQRTLAMKQIVIGMLKGEKYNTLVMFVIRFILPLKDHIIKKLLLMYFEIVPKTSDDGKLLPHMILVCDAYRKDLQSPNEYIRGSTLRFLCKLKEPELLEPLMPAVRSCLEHRHSYVRRNAVLCIYTIYKNFAFLIPDGPELVFNYLQAEQDLSCRRNAFMMLVSADQDRALEYLAGVMDQVPTFGDILQLVIVELVHRVCRTNPADRPRFIRCIYTLLNSQSPAVRYEAAGTLLTLSSAPTAVAAAAGCYIDLVVKESDNNVKLIVLQRLADMRNNPAQERVVQDSVMDLLRVLAAPDLEVRKKAMDIAMGLITSRNVDEVVQVLKKEIAKTHEESDTSDEYRQQLVKALHTCALKFPSVAVNIVPILMDFLGDTNAASAGDVITSVREAMEMFPQLRPSIVGKLLETFDHIKAAKVYRTALWILGEYSSTISEIDQVMEQLRKSIGDLPIVDSEMKRAAEAEGGEVKLERKDSLSSAATGSSVALRPQQKVTADGTYVTQSALTSGRPTKSESMGGSGASLRSLLLEGDFFLGAVLAATLTKLALRRQALTNDTHSNNKFVGESLLIMAAILHLGRSGLPATAIDRDSYDRILTCFRVLADPQPLPSEVFTQECRKALAGLLAELQRDNKKDDGPAKTEIKVQADDLIHFRQLGEDDTTQIDDIEKSLSLATGAGQAAKGGFTSALNKVFQLTGFSDPVYAEAYVSVNQYDIVLDVLVVNQTDDTLQNMSLELSTLGDLKLVERPTIYTMGPRDFITIKANVKVSSTETGIIFGNIVYDISGTTEHCIVVLNDIHIDVMDYIVPASCTDVEFRAMWAEFEWENKVAVNTDITSLEAYTQHILASTNMRRLAFDTGNANADECAFYAANLYARSIFGEDALANLSIERAPDGRISGHIRIRAKTQGIALSLGDKITLVQKSADK
eukprot:comp23295_c0_seq1/m.38237 comp23295_c0_seq1/g.38237  ORF comp23295_c0_seq1/g.38237 comp23295_c0_seq1/m.38237 type:complete len:959 (-) comp23295_c0_seq1:25-2901(-)